MYPTQSRRRTTSLARVVKQPSIPPVWVSISIKRRAGFPKARERTAMAMASDILATMKGMRRTMIESQRKNMKYIGTVRTTRCIREAWARRENGWSCGLYLSAQPACMLETPPVPSLNFTN